ncbi:hypothetical protein NBRC116601_31450 [Cognatishimia sp. WU-CL00825]
MQFELYAAKNTMGGEETLAAGSTAAIPANKSGHSSTNGRANYIVPEIKFSITRG